MVKFNAIHQIEKEYWFVPATADVEVKNGMFGTLAAGKFTPASTGAYVVMNQEEGDDAGLDIYKIPAKMPLRLLDTTKCVGEKLEVYGYPLEDGFDVGDTVGKFEIEKIIGNSLGAVVTVTE